MNFHQNAVITQSIKEIYCKNVCHKSGVFLEKGGSYSL